MPPFTAGGRAGQNQAKVSLQLLSKSYHFLERAEFSTRYYCFPNYNNFYYKHLLSC